ncbi:MAG: hypothetical protein ACE5JH_01365 [Acidobacteriota bacterium]
MERNIHDLFWNVPFLSETLVSAIASRLGCDDCSPPGGEAPEPATVSVRVIQRALKVMAAGVECPDGSIVYGIRALQPELSDPDPNLVIANSRAARGNLAHVPSTGSTITSLTEMGIRVPDAAEGSAG